MKLNMEIIYVPAANIYQKRDMMADWKETSKKASNLSFIGSVVSLMGFACFAGVEAAFGWLHLISALLFLLGGILSRRWKIWGYFSVFAATLVNCSVFSVNYNIEQKLYFYSCIAIVAFSMAPLFFSFRCIYNYKSVYKELEKSKGFPNFIANTADLYGKKIYLSDSDKTHYEESIKATYYGSNTEEDIKAEEFARSQNLKAREEKKVIVENHGGEDVYKREYKRAPKTYKYGKKIFGREVIFLHNNISETTFEEKKELMFKWHDNISWGTKHLVLIIFFMLIAAMAGGLGSIISLFYYFLIVLFIIGTNYIKMSEAIGPYMTLGVLIVYCLTVSNNFVSAAFALATIILGIPTILCSIRCILNRHIYKELSKYEGFPHFIKTTADLYGDKLYIIEKTEPVKRQQKTKDGMIIMDIGYDEKPKKDDGPWNAFDYRDKLKKGEDNNENNS